jgi:PmbA protein
MRRMGRGLLVTEQLGQGVNPVTGDFSRGAAGFWIEEGAIAYPVEEITIAGNLRQMFRDIVALGSDIDRRGSRHIGSMLIARMTIAGS